MILPGATLNADDLIALLQSSSSDGDTDNGADSGDTDNGADSGDTDTEAITLTIEMESIEDDALVGAYVSILGESRKVTANTETDDNGEVVLTLASDWTSANPAMLTTCSLCNVPEYVETDSDSSALCAALPPELELAVVYAVVAEWLSANNLEQEAVIYRKKSDVVISEWRLNREAKTAKRTIRHY